MISKNKIKQVHLLETKKGRKSLGLYLAEGPKVVGDLLSAGKAQTVYATIDWLNGQVGIPAEEVIEVSDEELHKISMLQHPQQVVATFPINERKIDFDVITKQLCIALDGVQDPGNLGTIIRVADWFGITNIFCSPDTADVYNPKVIQATMGSIARVNVHDVDLEQMIDALPVGTPIFATLLDGDDIYTKELDDHGLIIMGNEGKGISKPIIQKVNQKLFIPNYPSGRETADSLNVAIATAIVCGEFRRRMQ